MPSELSFENFKYTDRDRYMAIRQDSDEIAFAYLVNYVVADMDRRVLTIDVDDRFIGMLEKIEQFDRDDMPQGWEHPYLPYAGTIVENPIGEQLLTFCEADLEGYMKLILTLLQVSDAATEDTPEAGDIRKKFGIGKSSPVVKKPATREELDMLCYENYEYLMTVADIVVDACLYTSIFPPLIYTRSSKMFEQYFTYLLALQHEYKKLIDFCFDTDFYPDALDGLTAASRFHLYCETTDAVPIRPMNMSFRFTWHGFGNVSTTIRDKEAYARFKQNPGKALNSIQKRELNAFEKEYNISPTLTEMLKVMPIPIASSYRCGSLEEMLYLEFEKMLELDIRIKKCKNCGRYFIFKGNYQTEYCDRVPEGETQSCQAIAATAKYARKIKDNPALAIFNRAYKRYHARVKVGTVKPDAFKKWKYEAVVMRDRCLSGEMTAEEFEAWADGYFNVK